MRNIAIDKTTNTIQLRYSIIKDSCDFFWYAEHTLIYLLYYSTPCIFRNSLSTTLITVWMIQLEVLLCLCRHTVISASLSSTQKGIWISHYTHSLPTVKNMPVWCNYPYTRMFLRPWCHTSKELFFPPRYNCSLLHTVPHSFNTRFSFFNSFDSATYRI